MPIKTSEITYKNELSDFIDYNTIKSEVDNVKENIKKIESEDIEVLRKEITSGGLDLYAVNINGVPIFHNEGIDIYTKISTVVSECSSTLDTIVKNAKAHRTDELNCFVTAIENRINKLETQIADYRELADENYTKWKNTPGRGRTTEGSDAYDAYVMYKSKADEKQKELDGGWLSAYNGGLYSKLKDATRAQKEMES